MAYCKGGCGHSLVPGVVYCGGGARCRCGGTGEKDCPVPVSAEGPCYGCGKGLASCNLGKSNSMNSFKPCCGNCRHSPVIPTISDLKQQLKDAEARVVEAKLKSVAAEARLKTAEEKLIEWRKLSRQNAVEATSAENQLERLLNFLKDEAPHMSNCRYMWGEDCNCWKSRSPVPIVNKD